MARKVGIVIASHSKDIAKGTAEFISQVASNVPITFAGGIESEQVLNVSKTLLTKMKVTFFWDFMTLVLQK